MYNDFFGLTERPFSKTPDPRFLFLSHGHREALARMQYAVEERDIVLLTGDIGCGKTTLSRVLIDTLEDCKIILMINPRLTPVEFLRVLALRLDVADPARYKADLLEQIGGALFALFEQQIHPVLVIDEAQLVPHKETFDEIRLLTNFQFDDQNMISVVLMGQPELRRRLAHRAYEPLRQRIGMQYELKPLDAKETLAYIRTRMEIASGSGGTFTESAAQKIHAYSGGVPRKINHASGLALLEAFGRESRIVNDQVIDAVLAELSQGV